MVCAFFGADLGKITNVPGVLNALTKFSMAETDLIGCFEIVSSYPTTPNFFVRYDLNALSTSALLVAL